MSHPDMPLPPGLKQGELPPRWLSPDSRPSWLAYVLAVGAVVATLVFRFNLEVTFGERPLVIIFVIPIIISAYLDGLGPGLSATLRAATSLKYYLIPPLHPITLLPTSRPYLWEADVSFSSMMRPALTGLGKASLSHLGYQVVAMIGSLEALEVFRSQPEAFDLVITDLTMPKLTGLDLARKCQAIRPGIPLILCTGYAEQVNREISRDLGIKDIFIKPLGIRPLGEIVKKILNTIVRDETFDIKS
jgi:CheY-like chemotaxis protein